MKIITVGETTCVTTQAMVLKNDFVTMEPVTVPIFSTEEFLEYHYQETKQRILLYDNDMIKIRFLRETPLINLN